ADTYLTVFRGYGLVQSVAPASEPLTLADAKQWARVETTDDDALITSLIVMAREYAETITQRQLLQATWVMTIDRFPGGDPGWGRWWPWGSACTIRLPGPPLQSVSSINYIDTQGNTQTVNLSTDVIIDTQRDPPRLLPAWGKVWPV